MIRPDHCWPSLIPRSTCRTGKGLGDTW